MASSMSVLRTIADKNKHVFEKGILLTMAFTDLFAFDSGGDIDMPG